MRVVEEWGYIQGVLRNSRTDDGAARPGTHAPPLERQKLFERGFVRGIGHDTGCAAHKTLLEKLLPLWSACAPCLPPRHRYTPPTR